MQGELIGKSLSEQCGMLGIPLETILLPTWEKPEAAALSCFERDGWVGFDCEAGAVLTIIKAACLDTLAKLNRFGREDACTRFLEAQFSLLSSHKQTIVEAVSASTAAIMVSNFEEIIGHAFVRQCYPRLKTGTAAILYTALGPTRLQKLVELVFSDPYTFRSGWPDLTLAKDGTIRFVEVKTTDKLHKSQLISFPALRATIDADIRVVRLKRAK